MSSVFIMNQIFEEIIEIPLAAFALIGALSFLLTANQLVNQSNDVLPTNTTVYSEMHQTIEVVTWTGSQIQYTLLDIEELGIPIRVGGFTFSTEKDVKENIHSIFPNQTYTLQTSVNSKGEITEMQFYIKL